MRNCAKTFLKYIAYRLLPTKIYLQICYFRVFKRFIDFKRPKTLNEKLQWKKLYGYSPLHTIIADKYSVRKYIADRIGNQYLIPLLSVLNCASDFDLNTLPESFIIKANHGSGYVRIVRNKSHENESELKSLLRKWMKTNYYYRTKEPQYKKIKPLIIVEELLIDDDGMVPIDYKLHCFSGKVEAIQVDLDRFGDHRRNYYDVEWHLLPFTWTPWDKKGPKYPNGIGVEKPQKLSEIINIAETLSMDFDYVRVDLYYFENQIYFGELTLHHEGGRGRFNPPEYDRVFGDKLELSSNLNVHLPHFC